MFEGVRDVTIIHAADIHLGSRMRTHLPPEIADQRRAELRAAFLRLLDEAAARGAALVLLAGDVFDSDTPRRHDRDFFFSAIRAHADLQFCYLRGNHDAAGDIPDDLPNLHTFSDRWTTYDFDGVAVSGRELPDGKVPADLYDTLPDVPGFHIVLLHGQTADAPGEESICPRLFRGRGVSYLALGHVHFYSEAPLDPADPRGGKFCYPGCLEGRGFDEPGAHGCVLIDTDRTAADGSVSTEFLPLAQRTVREYRVDVSAAEDAYGALSLVGAAISCPASDLVRVLLTGEVGFDSDGLADDVRTCLAGRYFCVSVRDLTRRRISPEDYAGSLSLRGEFVRALLAADGLSDDDRREIFTLGMSALDGQGL